MATDYVKNSNVRLSEEKINALSGAELRAIAQSRPRGYDLGGDTSPASIRVKFAKAEAENDALVDEAEVEPGDQTALPDAGAVKVFQGQGQFGADTANVDLAAIRNADGPAEPAGQTIAEELKSAGKSRKSGEKTHEERLAETEERLAKAESEQSSETETTVSE